MGSWIAYAAWRAVGKLVGRSIATTPVPVGDYLLPDERARQALCAALAAQAQLDVRHVQVQVLSGELLLTGTVESASAKDRIEALAQATPGVESVRNELVIPGGAAP